MLPTVTTQSADAPDEEDPADEDELAAALDDAPDDELDAAVDVLDPLEEPAEDEGVDDEAVDDEDTVPEDDDDDVEAPDDDDEEDAAAPELELPPEVDVHEDRPATTRARHKRRICMEAPIWSRWVSH